MRVVKYVFYIYEYLNYSMDFFKCVIGFFLVQLYLTFQVLDIYGYRVIWDNGFFICCFLLVTVKGMDIYVNKVFF